jgi:hypothetical protein
VPSVGPGQATDVLGRRSALVSRLARQALPTRTNRAAPYLPAEPGHANTVSVGATCRPASCSAFERVAVPGRCVIAPVAVGDARGAVVSVSSSGAGAAHRSTARSHPRQMSDQIGSHSRQQHVRCISRSRRTDASSQPQTSRYRPPRTPTASEQSTRCTPVRAKNVGAWVSSPRSASDPVTTRKPTADTPPAHPMPEARFAHDASSLQRESAGSRSARATARETDQQRDALAAKLVHGSPSTGSPRCPPPACWSMMRSMACICHTRSGS